MTVDVMALADSLDSLTLCQKFSISKEHFTVRFKCKRLVHVHLHSESNLIIALFLSLSLSLSSSSLNYTCKSDTVELQYLKHCYLKYNGYVEVLTTYF